MTYLACGLRWTYVKPEIKERIDYYLRDGGDLPHNLITHQKELAIRENFIKLSMYLLANMKETNKHLKKLWGMGEERFVEYYNQFRKEVGGGKGSESPTANRSGDAE
jgi:hypothetical protein